MDEDAEIIEEAQAIVLFLEERGWRVDEQWVNGHTHQHTGQHIVSYDVKAFNPNPNVVRRIRIRVIISECELRALIDTPFSSSSDYIFGEELADPQCLRRFGDLLDGLS